MYAGNLGLTSSLEDVLGAAAHLKESLDIQFVIVGVGVKKPDLLEIVNRNRLGNVLFLPYQRRENYSEMLAAADISLVTLNRASSLSSLPSKVFNLMSSSRPILAVAPKKSELAQLIAEAQCGITVSPKEPAYLAEVILKLKQEECLRTRTGCNGRAQLMKKFSRDRCIDMHEQMLLDLCRIPSARENNGSGLGMPITGNPDCDRYFHDH